MKTLKLRDYQEEAIGALVDAWDSGMKRPSVVLPTGMGKTVIFAELIKQSVAAGRKPLVLVHRDELVKQTIKKIGEACQGVSVGVIKAERHELDGDVIVASVQTLGRITRLARTPSDVADLVIIDECHHAAADSYIRVLEHFGCFDPARPDALACGFTATMNRIDSRKLGDVWQDVVYTKDIMYGIANGYLVDVRGKMITVDDMDLGTVARTAGDYAEGSLGDALEASGAGDISAKGYIEHASRPDGTLRPGILFAPTRSSARHFADAFNAAGIPTEVVLGETDPEDRALIYKRTATGDNTVIASCGVLTEGFDQPEVEVAVIARLTSSSSLYVQMVGRVLRPAPWTGKQEALVLDVVGVSGRHPLASLTDLSTSGVKPEPGESLAEAVSREAAAKRKPSKRSISGTMAAVDVDLFHRSKSVWLQTYKGVWFIPTRACVIFLWPFADGYKVGRTHDAYTTKGRDAGWLHEGMSHEMAMSWAEQEAGELDSSIASKKSSWRVKKTAPSDAQKGLLLRYGLPHTADTTKTEASDMISVHFASGLLDRGIKG